MRPGKNILKLFKIRTIFEVVCLRNLPEVDFVRFVFSKLSRSAQHGLDCSRGQCMLPFDNELMTVRGDEFNIHGIRSFTTSIARLVFLKIVEIKLSLRDMKHVHFTQIGLFIIQMRIQESIYCMKPARFNTILTILQSEIKCGSFSYVSFRHCFVLKFRILLTIIQKPIKLHSRRLC